MTHWPTFMKYAHRHLLLAWRVTIKTFTEDSAFS